jgi:hypothetical protein
MTGLPRIGRSNAAPARLVNAVLHQRDDSISRTVAPCC